MLFRSVFTERSSPSVRKDEDVAIWHISDADAEKLSRLSGNSIEEIKKLGKDQISALVNSLRSAKTLPVPTEN